MDMKKKVNLELRDRSPAEVSMLMVDGCLSSDGEVQGVTEEFKGLEVLKMINVGLTSLSKLPSLPKLHKLDVGDNAISGGLESLAEKCPNLTDINLSGNKIKELGAIEAMKNLKNLKTLDLFGCEVTKLDHYRDDVFRLLPHITYLDRFDRHNNEASDSDYDQHDDADDVSEEDEEEVGLSYLMKDGIQDEEDDGDYVEEEDYEEDEEDYDEDAVQGEKRKRDDDDDGDDDDE